MFIICLKLTGQTLLILTYVNLIKILANNKIDAMGTYYMKNANWPQLKSILMNRNQIGMRKSLLKSRKW